MAVDSFSNAYSTTLNGAINNSVTSLVVTSATGAPPSVPFRLRVKAEGANTTEIMTVTAVAGTTFTVTRASEAYAGVQAASAHASGAVVEHVLTVGGLLSVGGMVLLEQHTASSSATLDFVSCISSTYDEYVIEFIEIIPSTNATALGVRVSTDGGATWDATSPHYYSNNIRSANGSWTAVGAANTYLQMAHDVSNGGILGVCGSVRFFPSNTAQRFFVGQVSYLPSAADRTINLVNGDYEQGTFNAIRFLFSGGNIASGTIRIYGIGK